MCKFIEFKGFTINTRNISWLGEIETSTGDRDRSGKMTTKVKKSIRIRFVDGSVIDEIIEDDRFRKMVLKELKELIRD